ncbi:MAG: aldo/keto reductase [Balneolaceae bacterium]
MILISKIGLGTVQFGMPYGISNLRGQTSPEEAWSILEAASDAGIDLLDTASAYGTAEKVLGESGLTGFRVVSKYMPPTDGAAIREQLEQSLDLLYLDRLYGYLAHRPETLMENPGQWEELLSLREERLVKKIGYSLNRPEELEQLLEEGFVPDLVQIPYNYFDRRFQPWFPLLKKQGCEIHVRSVFLQGLFFMHPEELGSHFDPVKPILLRLRKNIPGLAAALLGFALRQPMIDRVIVGVETVSQLQEHMEAASSIDSSRSPLPKLRVELPEEILMPSLWPPAKSGSA